MILELAGVHIHDTGWDGVYGAALQAFLGLYTVLCII